MGGMTELPRKAAARTARLAALPLGYAGRQAMGFGKRQFPGKPNQLGRHPNRGGKIEEEIRRLRSSRLL